VSEHVWKHRFFNRDMRGSREYLECVNCLLGSDRPIPGNAPSGPFAVLPEAPPECTGVAMCDYCFDARATTVVDAIHSPLGFRRLCAKHAEEAARRGIPRAGGKGRAATKKQEVPPMEAVETNVSAMRVVLCRGYDVYSWRDGPANSGVPCTQVHLMLDVDKFKIALRLKSARALDELVGALLQHRQDVWGAAPGRAPEGESKS